MKVFYDSSAFVKKFVEEEGSDKVDEFCQKATDIGLSVICLPEMFSALNRKLRENNLALEDYQIIKNQVFDDIEDIHIINLAPTVIQGAINALEQNSLRSLDALHIACAIVWEADLFVSSDKRQILAAENFGLQVEYI